MTPHSKPAYGFERKTYGRIWVPNPEDLPRVHNIIKKLDEFEFSYMPAGFVAAYADDIEDVIYGHKFELSISKLTQACWDAGIFITCVTGRFGTATFI